MSRLLVNYIEINCVVYILCKAKFSDFEVEAKHGADRPVTERRIDSSFNFKPSVRFELICQ